MTNITLVVDNESKGVRLDVFLTECDELRDYTRSRLQKIIGDGNVFVNGGVGGKSERLSGGETIIVGLPDAETAQILPQEMPLDILFEDKDIIVLNKQKGIVVHPAPGHYENTLVNGLLYHCKDSLSGINGVLRPGIVHRLDKDTSGVLVVAKNDFAHSAISKQLENRSVKRVYEALLSGKMELGLTKTINKPIKRSDKDRKKMMVTESGGKEAITDYTVTAQYDGFCHAFCQLRTGRTHQIRVHMEYLGHPCLGDPVYTKNINGRIKLNGQALHASTVGFIHPAANEYMEFNAALPHYFTNLLHS